MFYASGLTIEDRGYLEVYPYDKWTAKEIPNYQEGQVIAKFEVTIKDGSTTAPPLLTEADLIALMDRHGIGTGTNSFQTLLLILKTAYNFFS